MKNLNNQIRKDIFKFLKSNGILTLAVALNNSPWVCTLYYGIDEEMNLYVVTDPNSEHGKIMAANQKVSVNIFDSGQKITESKRGLQGRGTIKMIKGKSAVATALAIWHKANPGIENRITLEYLLKKTTDTKIYKIIPTYLKYFNKELYGEKEYGILELSK